MTAPFLKERLKWTESDLCWWCGTGGQTREHCFKGCITWRKEIGTLWKRVGQAEEKKARGGCERVCRKGKGFEYGGRVRQYHCKDERYVGAVLKAGEVKEGSSVERGSLIWSCRPFSFLSFHSFPLLFLHLSFSFLSFLSFLFFPFILLSSIFFSFPFLFSTQVVGMVGALWPSGPVPGFSVSLVRS